MNGAGHIEKTAANFRSDRKPTQRKVRGSSHCRATLFGEKQKRVPAARSRTELNGKSWDSYQTAIHLQETSFSKRTAPSKTKDAAAFAKKFIHERGHKNIVSAARRYGNGKKIITQI
jgi:hypothetical protein